MSNGCSHGGDLGAYSNARMFNSGADACSKAETRCSAVSRSAGDAENISGTRLFHNSPHSHDLFLFVCFLNSLLIVCLNMYLVS